MEIRGNLDIHELVQIRGGNPNNEYILTSSDTEGNSLWRQHWFLTQAQWDEWENTYNESEATQNKQITNLTNIVNELDDNYIVSGEVLVGSQELIFTDKNGGKIKVTNAAALFLKKVKLHLPLISILLLKLLDSPKNLLIVIQPLQVLMVIHLVLIIVLEVVTFIVLIYHHYLKICLIELGI